MEIYSKGKVLLTGEYVILDGALSLASPTKFGQHLKFEENQSNLINWKSINFDGKIWFECSIRNENLEIISTSSKRVSDTLIRIIKLIREYNPSFMKNSGSDISTNLTFDKNWGLGSSSTLISNLAKLSGVDPYILNNKIFKGSGYDIACADSNCPITYNINKNQREINEVHFKPIFQRNIYFVYLNQKQKTIGEIKRFEKIKKSSLAVDEISEITLRLLKCSEQAEFDFLVESHEKIISNLISVRTIKEELFNDFRGSVKSLGAWGGDFVMVSSNIDPSNYFENKGYNTIIKFKDMII